MKIAYNDLNNLTALSENVPSYTLDDADPCQSILRYFSERKYRFPKDIVIDHIRDKYYNTAEIEVIELLKYKDEMVGVVTRNQFGLECWIKKDSIPDLFITNKYGDLMVNPTIFKENEGVKKMNENTSAEAKPSFSLPDPSQTLEVKFLDINHVEKMILTQYLETFQALRESKYHNEVDLFAHLLRSQLDTLISFKRQQIDDEDL